MLWKNRINFAEPTIWTNIFKKYHPPSFSSKLFVATSTCLIYCNCLLLLCVFKQRCRASLSLTAITTRHTTCLRMFYRRQRLLLLVLNFWKTRTYKSIAASRTIIIRVNQIWANSWIVFLISIAKSIVVMVFQHLPALLVLVVLLGLGVAIHCTTLHVDVSWWYFHHTLKAQV